MTDHANLAAERQARLDDDHQRRVWKSRRVGHAVTSAALALVMATAVLDGLGVVDVFGVDADRVSATAGGTTLEVRYPSVSRPALASPWQIVITRDGGFQGQPVEVAVLADYLALWDLNGILPSPAEETADGERILWTFEPPEGDTLRIVYEARIEPGAQSGGEGRVAVLDDDGTDLVAVEFETRLRP